MKDKILMLGGSRQQMPAIEKAKELGYEVILMDYLPDNPGRVVADKWYCESTTDVEGVMEIAVKEKVSGILPYASDPAALPAALVCEKLGLPTNPAKSVEILGVKHKFREFLQKEGFPCPQTYAFGLESDPKDVKAGVEKLKMPIVVKPTDSSGSKGVTFLNSLEDLDFAIESASKYSRNRLLIAEEFIERGFPDVIGGDIFVENGRITLCGDMACLRGDGGKSLIPIGEKKPNGLNRLQKRRLYAELQRLVDALGIRTGELNIEVLIDRDDNPHFLEVGPRAGGNMIPVQLSDAYGIDLLKANVQAAMGKETDLKPEEPTECYMTYVLHSANNGILENIDYFCEVNPYIYRKVLYKQPGDKVEKFDGAGKALGIVFMKFPDEATMLKIQSNIENLITVNLCSK